MSTPILASNAEPERKLLLHNSFLPLKNSPSSNTIGSSWTMISVYTVSAGASYTYKDTTVYADLLYGSGLRSGFANAGTMPLKDASKASVC